jgi:hypothetical protein
MAELKISARANHVVDFSNKPRFPVADDPTGTPVSGYMDTDDIGDIATASATIVVAAAIATLVTGDATVTDGNLAVFDADGYHIKDGGANPDISTRVTGDATVTPGNIAVFGADGYTIEDGGAAPNVAGTYAVRTITATDDAETTDQVLICDKGTAMVVTLLEATGSGRWIKVGSIGAGAVTVQVASSGTLNASLTYILNQWDMITAIDISAGVYLIASVA